MKKIKNTFIARHKEGPVRSFGESCYVEDFHINNQEISLFAPGFPYCLAYGKARWTKEYRMRDYAINGYYSIELIVEGDAIFECAGNRYLAEGGDVLIFRPNKKFSLRAGESGFLRKKCALLAGTFLEYILDGIDFSGVNVIKGTPDDRLREIFAKFDELIVGSPEFFPGDISNICNKLLLELNYMVNTVRHPPQLRNAIDFIAGNLRTPIPLDFLASECGVSVSTLSRLFKTHLEMSPTAYIIERRLEKTKILLQVTDMEVKEIAEQCGFQTASFLSHSFKKKFGLSPKKARLSNHFTIQTTSMIGTGNE